MVAQLRHQVTDLPVHEIPILFGGVFSEIPGSILTEPDNIFIHPGLGGLAGRDPGKVRYGT